MWYLYPAMAEFIVSARKYRPQRFEEVVGQDHVAKTLKNAILTGKLAHAFLFTGPRGVGKTTCARILAKVLNCKNPIDQTDPCNECDACEALNNNASFNIFELDAASNNSVENIRDLVSQVRIPPQNGKYKVFIIDEVHMLSQAAFNAFLKTLEEPPSYAIFILATTEKHKIIPTVLSRCQIFDLKRIQQGDIVGQLAQIAANEGREVETDALHIIAEKSDGAMRDALSLFDKVSNALDEEITAKAVLENLKLLDFDYFFSLTDSFLKEDMSKVLLTIDEISKNGFEVEQLIQGLASHLRNLLMLKDPATVSLLNCSDSLKSRYEEQALICTNSFLLSALNILNQADLQMPISNNKMLHTEIALCKIVYLKRVKEVAKSTNSSAPSIEKKTPVLS